MSSKTRKLIWSVPLIATLAVVGALAAFVALGLPNANPVYAQDFTTEPGPPAGIALTPGNMAITVVITQPTESDGPGIPEFTGYKLQYNADPAAATSPAADDSGWMDVTGTVDVRRNGDGAMRVTGLTNGTRYYFRAAVTLGNDVGPYLRDNDDSTVPMAGPPGAPQNVEATQTGTRKIVVMWDPPADNGGSDIIGYYAQIKLGSGDEDSWRPTTNPETATVELPDTDAMNSALGPDVRKAEFDLTSATGTTLIENSYSVRVFALNSAQKGTGTDDAILDANILGADDADRFDNPGTDSISLEEAADISLLEFDAEITSDSTTSSGAPQLTVTFESLESGLPVGSSIVLYLEDDFQQPDSIPASSVFFVADRDRTEKTGSGASVYAVNAPRIKTGAYFDEDKKDIAIQVLIPDLCTTDTMECSGLNGPNGDQRFRMIILNTSGIKNPPEQGTHSVYFDVLGPADSIPTASNVRMRNDALRKQDEDADRSPMPEDTSEDVVLTAAKITLSDVDNSRGYEMTVAGSGFNNGTSASVHVLNTGGTSNMYLWDALNCPQMIRAVGMTPTGITATDMASPYCKMYAGLGATEKAKVDDLDFTKGAPEAELCGAIILKGSREGSADVGSDDKVDVTFAVTVPTFKAGSANYICMVDGEGRMSSTDVEDFKLEPSIRVVPSAANAGDTINVFAQDFPMAGAGFTQLKIANQVITDFDSGGSIGQDGAATVTFDLPGSVAARRWKAPSALTPGGAVSRLSTRTKASVRTPRLPLPARS